MSVLDNLLTGRHARIRTNPVAEMLYLPSVRRAEIEHRQAVARIIDITDLGRPASLLNRPGRNVVLALRHASL